MLRSLPSQHFHDLLLVPAVGGMPSEADVVEVLGRIGRLPGARVVSSEVVRDAVSKGASLMKLFAGHSPLPSASQTPQSSKVLRTSTLKSTIPPTLLRPQAAPALSDPGNPRVHATEMQPRCPKMASRA